MTLKREKSIKSEFAPDITGQKNLTVPQTTNLSRPVTTSSSSPNASQVPSNDSSPISRRPLPLAQSPENLPPKLNIASSNFYYTHNGQHQQHSTSNHQAHDNISHQTQQNVPKHQQQVHQVTSSQTLHGQNYHHPPYFNHQPQQHSGIGGHDSFKPPSSVFKGLRPESITSQGHVSSVVMSARGISNSLVRPERAPRRRAGNAPITVEDCRPKNLLADEEEKCCNHWSTFAKVLTCCIPNVLLEKAGGMHEANVRQAWREKATLCFLFAICCTVLGIITFGLNTVLCVENTKSYTLEQFRNLAPSSSSRGVFSIAGRIFNMSINNYISEHVGIISRTAPQIGTVIASSAPQDVTPYFPSVHPSCKEFNIQPRQCSTPQFQRNYCHDMTKNSNIEKLHSLSAGMLTYTWQEIIESSNPLIVLKDRVLDVRPFLNLGSSASNDPWLFDTLRTRAHTDVSRIFSGNTTRVAMGNCLLSLYTVGYVAMEPFGCLVSKVILYVSLVIILSVVFLKFILAIWFSYFISKELGKLKQKKAAQAPFEKDVRTFSSGKRPPTSSHRPSPSLGQGAVTSEYTEELFTVMMVTCYSEGAEGIKSTMESLANTSYNDDYKLMFLVADGMITGAGNSKSTPEIILDYIQLDPEWADPQPQSYLAIADGSKRHNMAKVYAGWYVNEFHSVPTILVVKCGTPEEAKAPKPGNRGKRDSQMIVMNLFYRVLVNELMTPLDFDMFMKIRSLMGVHPDAFEICLMVDADTKVAEDSLSRMVACMARDPLVMGLCGETRIGNKAESWVSRIQVFEYFMSHHFNKAFESIFGGVTCLPGCFCMYRIKAPKENDVWVPILANPDIIATYSENVVETLHKKNLLLLGEDRFLTTLMLRTFPRRKLIFVPRAYCKTTVPTQFKVLLSQRRRWINSTIHNLFELTLVRELCGTFCLSMQAVIVLELIGTVTLPAAITFTIYLVVSSIVLSPQIIPLLLLAAILGLPAILILLTSKRPIYIYWMAVYLLALPIWNFVLPVYAFWHFDDFSWGQTRKVQGDKGDKSHGQSDGKKFADDTVPMMTCEEWEFKRHDLHTKPNRSPSYRPYPSRQGSPLRNAMGANDHYYASPPPREADEEVDISDATTRK